MNVNWEVERVDRAAIAADPKLAHYVRFRPERGDFGLVAADQDDSPLGVVWLLRLPADDPGYGFMDDDTPELSVCVWPAARRRGLGRRLIAAALDEAGKRGLRRVSLSVEDGNPAVELYRALGFEPVTDALNGTYAIDL
jgi:ribosomal protein S18 acetylase RimI-like enzyme